MREKVLWRRTTILAYSIHPCKRAPVPLGPGFNELYFDGKVQVKMSAELMTSQCLVHITKPGPLQFVLSQLSFGSWSKQRLLFTGHRKYIINVRQLLLMSSKTGGWSL